MVFDSLIEEMEARLRVVTHFVLNEGWTYEETLRRIREVKRDYEESLRPQQKPLDKWPRSL